ncbi:MAG: glycosyltransferase family 39 protein, partial [Anaerolineae bacterium]|nr:glycosyltransferase family 39 protein [Phycisphaerae bacterium]
MSRARERSLLVSVLTISALVFLLGITWGLPSRKADSFLFGDHPVWSGKEIAALAADRASQSNLGADVDRNPLARSTEPVVLNATDQQRAEIVRRYRLYTYQPDEMITMMALASMRPGIRDFDPKLYQYGGLWIYPVGALIKVFANPKADSTYYLDHPEEFGRFYVIARLYTAAWAILGACSVFWIVRRLTNQPILAAGATLCYAFMPVVVNMAHEAKPHLPAAVLILLAIIAATKFIDTGKKRWWAIAGALVGAAAGMVLSAIPAIVILPIMAWLRRETWGQRFIILLASVVIAIDVYFITNPYVLIHLLGDRTVLLSNLRNSQAMYQAPPSIDGVVNAIRLLGLGTAGLIAILALARIPEIRKHPLLVMLAAASAIILIQFFMLATNKPAEYARFALLPDIAMTIVAFAGLASFKPRIAYSIAAMALIPTAFAGASYVWHFIDDSQDRSTRIIAAERLQKHVRDGATTIAVGAEPAPYSVPPVDLFRTRLILQGDSSRVDIAMRTVDVVRSRGAGVEYWARPRLIGTPISWAHKP